MEANLTKDSAKVRTSETQVYVISAQKFLMEERMKIITDLWANGIKTEHSYKKSPKMLNQLQFCEDNGIPLAVVIGESEIAAGIVKLRCIASREEVEVKREDMIENIRSRLTNI